MTDVETIQFEWHELKHYFLGFVNGKIKSNQYALNRNLREWNDPNNSFTGCTAEEMKEWVLKGYKAEEFKGLDSYVPGRKARHLVFGEEGELQVELAYSGHDYPYLDWEQREKKPGMKVIVQVGFLGRVPVKVISEYGKWVASLLFSLESKGYDLEVDISNKGVRRWEHQLHELDIQLRVKRENEASDFNEWSSLFAPGSYRTLFFTLHSMACDKLGQVLNDSHGRSSNREWKIEWTPDTRTLVIGSDFFGMTFPKEDMNRQYKELGI